MSGEVTITEIIASEMRVHKARLAQYIKDRADMTDALNEQRVELKARYEEQIAALREEIDRLRHMTRRTVWRDAVYVLAGYGAVALMQRLFG
jgi:hypothetical protein